MIQTERMLIDVNTFKMSWWVQFSSVDTANRPFKFFINEEIFIYV